MLLGGARNRRTAARPRPHAIGPLCSAGRGQGIPLSIAWRRTRNLTGPALAHAVNDAVRNAVMLGL